MAASMLRSASASALRHRPSSSVLHLGRAAAGSTASSPPATMAIAASTRRHLCTANNLSAPEEEQRKQVVEMAQVEAAKAELLQQMMLEDATADRDKIAAVKRATTKQLADIPGRQFGLAAMPAADVDKNLLLALLVRSSRMEQEMGKLRSSTARAEQEMEKLRSEVNELNEEIFG